MQKKTIIKIASALLALLLVITAIGCGKDETVMTYSGKTITRGEFEYYLATYKAKFDQIFKDYENTAEFYSTAIDESGMTAEKYLFSLALENIKLTLVSDALFTEYGLVLPDEAESEIDDYIADIIDDYADGDKKVMNKALSNYGIDISALREIYLRDERVSILFDYLYGDVGVNVITEDDKNAYAEETYSHIIHIYVNNKFKYAADSDGFAILDTNGLPKKNGVTPEESAVKEELISAIDASLSEGGDFYEIYDAFSEDKQYKNGYYLTRSTDFIPEVVSVSFKIEVGEVVKIESDYGTHYIKRISLGASPWKDSANSDFFSSFDGDLQQHMFAEFVKQNTADVTVDESIINQYSIEKSPSNYLF